MEKTKVIITDLNYRNGYQDFYNKAHKFCYTENELFVKNIANIMDKDKFLFPIIDNFEELETEIKNTEKCNIIIFANFPSDNTYQRYRVESDDNKYYYFASGYSKTSNNFKEILKLDKNISLHIITGASNDNLSDSDIRSISEEINIKIVRKSNWLYQRNSYQDLYKEYVLNILKLVH